MEKGYRSREGPKRSLDNRGQNDVIVTVSSWRHHSNQACKHPVEMRVEVLSEIPSEMNDQVEKRCCSERVGLLEWGQQQVDDFALKHKNKIKNDFKASRDGEVDNKIKSDFKASRDGKVDEKSIRFGASRHKSMYAWTCCVHKYACVRQKKEDERAGE